jgi:DhnA family fructose-bisphosphate aldolase class Ia/sugar phosphate isomerase/epimerase
MRGEARKDYLLSSLQWILDDPVFQSIEITRIKYPSHRREVKERLEQARAANRIQEVVYSAQMVQLNNEDQECLPSDISSLDEKERLKAVERLQACVDEALEYGCEKFAFLSGKDPALMNRLSGAEAESVRADALSQLRRSVHEICQYIKDNHPSDKPMLPLLEVFDFRSNPPQESPFKEALLGPASRAESFAEYIRNYYGHREFSLMLDSSHLLINGEGPEIVKRLCPYIGHFHIGNVVLNRNNPGGPARYGDVHPALHVPDSELTEPVLAGYLSALVESDYTGTIAFEIKPIGSEIPEDIAESAKSFYLNTRNRIDVNYAYRNNYRYISRKFFSDALWDRLVDLRVNQPELIRERFQQRKQRENLTPDGKLVILAADHPARMVTNVGDDPVAMGDRFNYLGRIVRVLLGSSIDGLMATADIFEDLVLVDYLYQQKSGRSFLDEKVLIACMNRGGLAGARYEMYDRMTAYRDVKKIKELKMDGAKMLLRFSVPDPYDRYCIQTMEECARAVEACNEQGLPVFMEPLPVRQIDGQYKVIMKANDLIRVIGVAAGLSHSSANMWMKIPYVDDYHRVVSSYSGPILMLGGESTGNPTGVIEQFVRGMGEGENVRGAMVGRNVIFPGDDDPAAVAEAVHALVHEGITANEAVKRLAARRGDRMNLLPRE